VRDLPGVIEVNNPYLHIEGSSGVAVAFESSNVTQTVNIQQKVEQAQALVDAIERALPAVTDDRVRTDAEQLRWKSVQRRIRRRRSQAGSRSWPRKR
jgi:hypothetical protein